MKHYRILKAPPVTIFPPAVPPMGKNFRFPLKNFIQKESSFCIPSPILPKVPSAPSTFRCAIYTRKSTEEGLDSTFNSLDAQRIAGEAYVLSHSSCGYHCIEKHYDDGGFSGKNTKRPALEQLKQDIVQRQVDIVIVYKIDRLSRSLLDFIELLRFFEKHNVSFVSVTQDIDTTSSSGRMMLNILATFAQYEREVITERIRDKIDVSKRRGLYMGGIPPFGYKIDPVTHQLQIEELEMTIVRAIYEKYLELGNVCLLANFLQSKGIFYLSRKFQSGRQYGGHPFSRSMLYHILGNPIYAGKIRHRGELFPGQHPTIVSPETWKSTQKMLEISRRGGNASRTLPFSLLRGLVRCGYCGCVLKERVTCTPKRNYRYFICPHAFPLNSRTCILPRLSAENLEEAVLREMHIEAKGTKQATAEKKMEMIQLLEKRLLWADAYADGIFLRYP